MSQDNDLFASEEAPIKLKAATPKAKAKKALTPAPAPKKLGVDGYSAADIEVLEGLEPVRRRPGMYIGGTDINALHHLFAEVIDNSMDEAIAGHATRISVHLDNEGYLSITDNGRGIPVGKHPKFPDKSALEIIMTTLHAGGKFDSDAYETSGGLHGVGISVVNALSDDLIVEVVINQVLYRQTYSRGFATSKLIEVGKGHNRRGTSVRFHPDAEIFGTKLRFLPERIFKMSRAKAYLFGGIEIRWSCDEELASEKIPAKQTFLYSGGLRDFMETKIADAPRIVDDIFSGTVGKPGTHGAVEWAISWYIGDSFTNSYCNTVPTQDGGTHEAGLRTALLKGLKAYAELSGNKRAATITAEDVLGHCGAMLSVFVREPEFVGQTKDKLASIEAIKIVDNAVRDAFDHWLAASPAQAGKLLEWALERADERIRRRKQRDIDRQSATKRLRLPGKLSDCTQKSSEGAELFIVEGDSAGGSAKQARNRKNQAILPLRGKVLNVCGASYEKVSTNQQISDLIQALGCGIRDKYSEDDLRYEKIIIMTDADVDGAHIAALLMTFFFSEMPKLIENGHLYLGLPPLFRITQGAKTLYAMDDEDKERLMAEEFSGRGKVEVTRFKGLGEMPYKHLKETTMNPASRKMLKISILDDALTTTTCVERLMGNRPEARFDFIQENAQFVTDLDI